MKAMHMIAFILVIVGALNWLFVAFGYNLVEWVAMGNMTVESTLYVLVGLSAVWLIFTHKKDCRVCNA